MCMRVRAEIFTCTRVRLRERARTCVYMCACTYLIVFACASVHTGVQAYGCANVTNPHVRK
jgi:hypothetical protein